MEYLLSFLEGIITFLSPCLLPMLPVYISYFTGGEQEEDSKKTLFYAFAFVLGFTFVFVMLGAFAGSIGGFLKQYQKTVNIISGLIVIMLGFNFLGFLPFSLPFRGNRYSPKNSTMNFFSAFIFGIVFSIGWTPCVGAFLGSALMLASQQGSISKGIVMLLCYSLGMGIPFLLSALLLNYFKSAFQFIKNHYDIINRISGGMLILVGIAMMTGYMNKLLSFLTFK